MCGICGEFSLSGEPVNKGSIAAMVESIKYRGPDDCGIHAEGPIGLGFVRLAILDLSVCGHQPMWNDDRSLCIVFNGEIYNFREIARELESLGCRSKSTGDTEVILNAVRTWGVEAAVRKFIGMFAFALWSPRDGKLTFVRDRVGVKPLFYWTDSKRVLFGSEMRALMSHPDFTKDLDPHGLGQFFVTGVTMGESTALRGVKRVLPGHILTVDRTGKWTDTEYWSLDNVARSRDDRTVDDAADELESLLESAIAYRLVSDVPVTNFLSGGVDSSLVAAILKKKIGADVSHITVGFEEAAFDEAPKASKVAHELGLDHETHYVKAAEAERGLELFHEIFDEPFGDTSGIPTHILSKFAREKVKVALSADGGDEQFCGYDSYGRYAAMWERLRKVPAPLRQGASALGRSLPLQGMLRIGATGRRESSLRPQSFARAEKAMRIGGARNENDIVRLMFEKAWHWDGVPSTSAGDGGDLFDRSVLSDNSLVAADDELIGTMMRTDYKLFLRDDILTKVDRASMHVSLEAREPMLDHRIAEFSFGLPLPLLYGNGEQKRLLKHLLRRWVSEDIVSSPKRGFSIPLYAWMRGIWKPAVEEHLSREAVIRVGVLDPAEVRSEVELFYKHPGRSAERIWMLLSFQMWAERWYCRSAAEISGAQMSRAGR